MATVGKKIGRLDVRLVRGDSERLGGRWRQKNMSTGEVTPVDLGSWSGVVELRSPDGSELWYSCACGEMTSDGYAIAGIPPSAFTDAVWASRRYGQWKVTVTSPDGGTRRTLGWGYYALSD